MGDVIQFKPKETGTMYWQCTCGCQLFYITLEGYECSECSENTPKEILDNEQFRCYNRSIETNQFKLNLYKGYNTLGIQIEVLSQKVVTKPAKTPGKTYTALEVAYKNLTFQGKVEGKNIMSFGVTEDTFKELSNASTGDVYDVEVVKNSGGFLDWVSVKKGSAAAPAASASASRPPSGNTSSPTQVRSTYETPEERAKKQIFIVRQSSISSAIDLLSIGAKSAPTVDAILETASKFEQFVFGEGTPNEPVETLAKGTRIEDIQDSDID